MILRKKSRIILLLILLIFGCKFSNNKTDNIGKKNDLHFNEKDTMIDGILISAYLDTLNILIDSFSPQFMSFEKSIKYDIRLYKFINRIITIKNIDTLFEYQTSISRLFLIKALHDVTEFSSSFDYIEIDSDFVYNTLISHFEKIFNVNYEKLGFREGSLIHGKSLTSSQVVYIIENSDLFNKDSIITNLLLEYTNISGK